jgi:hypothetical protein
MHTQPQMHFTSLEQIIQRIFETRCITRLDQQQFMRMVRSAGAIAPQDQALINRVFDALRHGRLKVTD